MKIKLLLLSIFLVSISVYSLSFLRVGSVLWGDALYYYAYTRSLIIDHNIDFTNEAYMERGAFPNPPEISEITHKITNKFSPGVSILWIPGFLLGQSLAVSIARISSLFNLGILIDTSGYGFITLLPVALSTIGFGVLGLYFTFRTLLLLNLNDTAKATIFLLYCTTPLFYYLSIDPVNSHPASFMLSALLFYFSIKTLVSSKVRWQRTIVAGLVAGMLVLVRNQDLVLTLPMLLIFLFKPVKVLEKVNQLVLFFGSVFIIFSIQLFFTLELYGLFTSPYLHRGEQLYLLQPDFFRVLFSYQNGIFFFSPVLLIALGTLVYYFQKLKLTGDIKRAIVLSLLTIFLVTYVIAAWGPEILGGPYGSRMFVSSLPYFSIGIALFLRLIQKKYRQVYTRFYYVLLFVFGMNMLIQTVVMLVRY